MWCLPLALLPAALQSALLPAVAATALPRPNFVIILLDDMRTDDLAAMPQTRALIAGRGARFDNAYAPFPLCCPARASILTGQYAHNHGVLSNGGSTGGVTAFNPRHTLATWLRPRGYTTAYVGKYLNGYGTATSPDYVPRGWLSWQAIARRLSNYRNFALNLDGALRPYSGYQTHVLGRRTTRFIRRADSRPFFLLTSFFAPHSGVPHEADDPTSEQGCLMTNPCRNPTPFVSSVYADSEAGTPRPTSPAYDEADVSDKPNHIQALPSFPATFSAIHQEMYEQRLESIRSVDDQVANIVQTLADEGRLRRTYIVVTSDNGYLLGEHRITLGKVHPYEPSARIPMLMRGPGITPGARVEQLVGLHDLAPTVLRATGTYGAQTLPLDGRSLLGLIDHDRASAGRDLVLEAGPIGEEPDDSSLRRSTPAARPYRGILTNTGWKYIQYDTKEVEMYNLRTDPHELSNLANDTTYASRREALRQALTTLSTCRGQPCTVDTGR